MGRALSLLVHDGLYKGRYLEQFLTGALGELGCAPSPTCEPRPATPRTGHAPSDLEVEYERSLRAKAVSGTVQPRVDAVVHNQQSSLDHLAHRLVEAGDRSSREVPGLRGARPDVEAASGPSSVGSPVQSGSAG